MNKLLSFNRLSHFGNSNPRSGTIPKTGIYLHGEKQGLGVGS